MKVFFKDFIAESKRVVWPSKEELIKLTGNVISLSVVVSLIIFVMDILLSQGVVLLQRMFVK